MDDDDRNLLDELKSAILKTIDGYEESSGVDMAFYPIKVDIGVMNYDFTEILEMHNIIDTINHPCSFCSAPTEFLHEFDKSDDGQKYVCASCYGKMKKV
jgi:NAD-dependent SIR2 family protein deacetylase